MLDRIFNRNSNPDKKEIVDNKIESLKTDIEDSTAKVVSQLNEVQGVLRRSKKVLIVEFGEGPPRGV